MMTLATFLDVDWHKPSLWLFLCSSLFNPLFWNVVARAEYRHKLLTRTIGCGNSYRGCYVLAATIFSLGILRDILYKTALEEQPKALWLVANAAAVEWAAIFLLVLGNVFVLTSMYQLGITGTYLGDYFGILMKERVTAFPFNVMENPMYNGSTMVFLGTALWYKSGLGVLLSVWVFVLYQIALLFEGPYTAMIYTQSARKQSLRSRKRD